MVVSVLYQMIRDLNAVVEDERKKKTLAKSLVIQLYCRFYLDWTTSRGHIYVTRVTGTGSASLNSEDAYMDMLRRYHQLTLDVLMQVMDITPEYVEDLKTFAGKLITASDPFAYRGTTEEAGAKVAEYARQKGLEIRGKREETVAI